MRTNTTKFSVSAILLVTTTAVAQPPKSVTPPSLRSSKAAADSGTASQTVLQISAGTGEYPIIEMPILSQGGIRADGSSSEQDIKTNRGILLNLNLGRSLPTNIAQYAIQLGFQRIASAPGGGLPTPSSYMRLNAEAEARFDIRSLGVAMTPALEARRSMYRNVESGHYMDALLVKTSIERNVTDETAVDFSIGYAPLTRFGLLRTSDLGNSGALADTTSSLMEFGGQIKWTPIQSTSFFMALTQESAIAKLASSDGYRSYGLDVAPYPDDRPIQVYDLTTRQLSIGTVKRF